MKSLTVTVFIFVLFSTQCSGWLPGWLWNIKTVNELDGNSYMGQWHETHSSLLPKKTFQKDCFCTTAMYKLREDGKITVHNSCRKKGPKEEASDIRGYAYGDDPKVPGKLKVVFPIVGNGSYWVAKLGPLNKDGLYSYSVVTTNLKSIVWILVRDVEEYKMKYDAEVHVFLKENGYDWFWNRPRETYQGKDCLYPEL